MKNRINKIGAALTILTFGIICGIGGYELRSFTDSASSPLPISKGGTGTNSFPANSVITGNGALPMSSRGIDAVPQPSSNAVLTSGGAYNAYSSIQGAGQFIFRLGTAELGGQYITFRYDPNTKILHFSQNTGAKNFTWGAGEADRHVNIILKLPTGWKINFSDALGYQSLEGNGTHRYGGSTTLTPVAAGLNTEPGVFYLPPRGTDLNEFSCSLAGKAWTTVRTNNGAGNLAVNISGSIFVDSLTIG